MKLDLLVPPWNMPAPVLDVWCELAPRLLREGRLSPETHHTLAVYCQMKAMHGYVEAMGTPDVVAFSWRTILTLAEWLGIDVPVDAGRDN